MYKRQTWNCCCNSNTPFNAHLIWSSSKTLQFHSPADEFANTERRPRSATKHHAVRRSAVTRTKRGVKRPLHGRKHVNSLGNRSTPLKKDRVKRTDYFLHHPIVRAVGPRRVCDRELMVNTQGFAHAGQNRVLEMRGGVTHPHTRHPQSLTPCSRRRSSRFGGTNIHSLHRDEVAKIIHDLSLIHI